MKPDVSYAALPGLSPHLCVTYYPGAVAACYRLYAEDGPLSLFTRELIVEVPETPENTADMHVILEALRRIAVRHPKEMPHGR